MPAVRAIICDIYGTLLEPGPPPPDAAERWERGCESIAGRTMRLTDFDRLTADAVASQNALGRAAGEPFPEVDWLAIVQATIPGLTLEQAVSLSLLHAACSRTCGAVPGALGALEVFRNAGVVVGIASNAQHYTWHELEAAGFHRYLFESALCFLSGEHGFAKPSPRVFAWLKERLASLGIAPDEALMAGDSMEKDILPARAAGLKTWLIGNDDEHSWHHWPAQFQSGRKT
ncbi:MAG TPA: HAD family hydrolase [Verrucomicrobiales bacterium]|nr:HAD family hydrolase [Verrucomicrobiales bacterium]